MRIIQFQAMPNDEKYQGCMFGLGDDGVMYVNFGMGWEVQYDGSLSEESKRGE